MPEMIPPSPRSFAPPVSAAPAPSWIALPSTVPPTVVPSEPPAQFARVPSAPPLPARARRRSASCRPKAYWHRAASSCRCRFARSHRCRRSRAVQAEIVRTGRPASRRCRGSPRCPMPCRSRSRRAPPAPATFSAPVPSAALPASSVPALRRSCRRRCSRRTASSSPTRSARAAPVPLIAPFRPRSCAPFSVSDAPFRLIVFASAAPRPGRAQRAAEPLTFNARPMPSAVLPSTIRLPPVNLRRGGVSRRTASSRRCRRAARLPAPAIVPPGRIGRAVQPERRARAEIDRIAEPCHSRWSRASRPMPVTFSAPVPRAVADETARACRPERVRAEPIVVRAAPVCATAAAADRAAEAQVGRTVQAERRARAEIHHIAEQRAARVASEPPAPVTFSAPCNAARCRRRRTARASCRR